MISAMMRAIRVHKFGSPKVLQLDNDVSIPSVSDNHVLIKVKSSGVNPVDTYIREGAFGALPELPYIPGKDGAGIVESVGKKVSKFQAGQRVFFCQKRAQNGSCAEYALINEKEVFPLDETLTFHQGAAIGIPYFTAYRALFTKAHGKKKETVLIHGASGGVGLAAVQIANAYQMKVIGTAGTPEGINLVKQCGAHHVFCHKEKDYINSIMEATDNTGVDIILEMLSDVNLDKDLSLLAPKGRVIIVGCRGTVKINPRDMMGPETSIIGVALLTSTEDEWEELTSAVVTGIEKGWVQPIIDKVYPFDKLADAHHDILHSKGAKGKLVISISEE